MAETSQPQRILIIKPSSLGDVATALPMLCDLHDSNPTAQIDWLIHPTLAPVLAGHEAIRTLIPFDRKKLAGWWYEPTAFKLFGRFLQLLRGNHYDIVIDAQGLFRSGFLARVTGAANHVSDSPMLAKVLRYFIPTKSRFRIKARKCSPSIV